MYSNKGEVLYGKIDYLVTYLILTCNDNISVYADEHVIHRKGPQEIIAFILKVRGVNVITIIINNREIMLRQVLYLGP